MKIAFFLAVCAAAVLSGCQTPATKTQQNGVSLLAAIGAMDISANDVTQTTKGPFYNHAESVTSFVHNADGSFDVAKLSAEFNIPFPVMGIPLLTWTFSANAIHGTRAAKIAQVLPSNVSARRPAK